MLTREKKADDPMAAVHDHENRLAAILEAPDSDLDEELEQDTDEDLDEDEEEDEEEEEDDDE